MEGKRLLGKSRALLPRGPQMLRVWYAIDELFGLCRTLGRRTQRPLGRLVEHMAVRRETLSALRVWYLLLGDDLRDVKAILSNGGLF